jgi:hypothetical protein
MSIRRMIVGVVMSAVAGMYSGCGSTGRALEDTDHIGRASTVPTPDFNGAFNRPPGADYFEPAAGWTVEPSYFFALDPNQPSDPRLHPTARGHGGVFFQADAGRNGGVALYFQLCYATRDPAWCEGPIIVSSSRFPVASGTPYRLGLWFRSTIFLASAPPRENRTRLSIHFYDSNGNDAGSNGFAIEPNEAPVESWTSNFRDVMIPGNVTTARIEVAVDRNHQSHVYIDDVVLIPI